MAKKNSGGGGIVIIGLIVLVMVAKYWYLLVTAGAIALMIWGIAKVAKSWSSSETQNSNQQPSARPDHIETTISGANFQQPSLAASAPVKQSAKCPFCTTEGSHSILRFTDKTIDLHCSGCGKNFFIFKSDSNRVTTDYQPSSSTSQPNFNDATIFGAGAQQTKSVPPDTVWVSCGRTCRLFNSGRHDLLWQRLKVHKSI